MVDKLVTKVKYELIAETSRMLRASLSVIRLVTVTGIETGGGNEINTPSQPVLESAGSWSVWTLEHSWRGAGFIVIVIIIQTLEIIGTSRRLV